MKKLHYTLVVLILCTTSSIIGQDVLFSYSINNTDPTNSVVSVFAQFDGTGNSNAAGYTVVFYYDENEATSISADVNYTPTSNLGWNIAGNTTYSNNPNSNPLVPTFHTNRMEVAVLDGNFVGTNFSTTPSLLLTISFNKSDGTPLQGGDIYIGATADTDPAIVYFDNNFNGYNINITGERLGVLPLNLVSFKAKKFQDKSSYLTWTTSSETNTSHFSVQRSFDKRTWTTIGSVDAAGNSQIIKNYEFVDENVYNGVDNKLSVYYRLQMVDRDGQKKNSPIENIVFGEEGLTSSVREFLVYPNPASDGVQVEWETEPGDQPTSLELYDVTGKLVFTQDVAENSNQEYIDFGLTNIESGMYLLRIMSGDRAIEHKQIVVGQNR